MTNPLRFLSLVGCAAAGAILAYVFGISHVRSQIEVESTTRSAASVEVIDQFTDDAWAQEPGEPTAEDLPPPFAIPEPLPLEQPEPRIATEEDRQIGQHATVEAASPYPMPDPSSTASRDSSFTIPQPGLLPVPEGQLSQVAPVQMAVPAKRAVASQVTGQSTPASQVASAGHRPPTQPPSHRHQQKSTSSQRVDEFQPEQESSSYVVLNPDDARPLLTLRLGRLQSQQMTAAEMTERPVRSARPAVEPLTEDPHKYVQGIARWSLKRLK